MPLSVIGAGQPRTGTKSLKLALEELGFGPCHHMIELFQNPEQPTLWARKLEGERLDWDEVLKGYRSACDAPSCYVYKDLMARYPEAKVILTIRPAESWWTSARATVMSDISPARNPANFPNGQDMARFFQGLRRATAESQGGIARTMTEQPDRDRAIDDFNRHNEEVMRVVPKDRLLVFEAKQGWEPLCGFLGVPVPAKAYPRTNSTEEFVQRQQTRIAARGNS